MNQRTEVPRPGETGKSREITAEMYLPGGKAAGTINWQEHYNGKVDELFEAECGLARE